MDEQTNEQFYDEEIAPVLHELAQLCCDHGLSFVACVEIRPGRIAHTVFLNPDAPALTLLNMADGVLDGLREDREKERVP